MPWHWQLFLRWLVRGPDVSSIPERLYPELNILCYSADKKGRVNGYKGSKEIAYALGNFDCERSPDGQYWIIQDTYSFAVPGEAGPGSPLAIFLVSMVGTNYSYQIQGIVPILPQ
ncbi:hypothetical protein [Gloeothece verrucosa]|uniref:Uncharacterized protein n=1 Tax=Gloeothece verrucosa (strain PCC 7822) TaxID=497965 RepID=E0UDS8_GLOV7|nr:hypothetical protein [Gloeothece verrucosa]ADN16513.1 conserved hypothetical protein [Gloeothece verrucosa PCC 7822]